MSSSEIKFSSLDQPLFGGLVKGDLVEYLDFVADRFVPVLADHLGFSVTILSRKGSKDGQEPFMQKNVPKYTPSFVKTVEVWAETSHRQIKYALCDDKQTLMWFANQRAVEYHVPLFLGDHQTHMVLDVDPPEGADFDVVVKSAFLIREALGQAGLEGAVKTSGAKGVHIFVPLEKHDPDDVAAATRAVAARAEQLDPDLATTAYIKAERGGKVFLDSTRAWGATVVAAYSPRVRPGAPVSFPVSWDDIDSVSPRDFTVRTAAGLLEKQDPWATLLPPPQKVDPGLVEEGHTIPVARVQAMHEGKRRARARRSSS